MMLQMEEDTHAGGGGRPPPGGLQQALLLPDDAPLRQVASQERQEYVIRRCRAAPPPTCCGCGHALRQGELEVRLQNPARQELRNAHVGCLPLLPGLTRPWLGGPGPRRGAVLRFDADVAPEERHAVELQLQELPPPPPPPAALAALALPPPARLLAEGLGGAAGGLPPWLLAAAAQAEDEDDDEGGGARPRGHHHRQSLQRRLLRHEGDFTPEDYEMLLELDNSDRKRRRLSEVALRKSLIESFPESLVRKGAPVERCSICLDDMVVGSKIRTLPCMHFFHKKCIDKWLKQGGPPKCPVDQTLLEAGAFDAGSGGGSAAGGGGHASGSPPLQDESIVL